LKNKSWFALADIALYADVYFITIQTMKAYAMNVLPHGL